MSRDNAAWSEAERLVNQYLDHPEGYDGLRRAIAASLSNARHKAPMLTISVEQLRERLTHGLETCHHCHCELIGNKEAPYCEWTCEGDHIEHPSMVDHLVHALLNTSQKAQVGSTDDKRDKVSHGE